MEHQLRIEHANKSGRRDLPNYLAGQARATCRCGWAGVWLLPDEAEAALEAARPEHS